MVVGVGIGMFVGTAILEDRNQFHILGHLITFVDRRAGCFVFPVIKEVAVLGGRQRGKRRHFLIGTFCQQLFRGTCGCAGGRKLGIRSDGTASGFWCDILIIIRYGDHQLVIGYAQCRNFFGNGKTAGIAQAFLFTREGIAGF